MNWEQRIARAEKRGRFTDVDRRLAKNWDTCAIGESHGNMTSSGPGFEDPIAIVGYEFEDCVDHNDMVGARATYYKIREYYNLEP